MSSFTISQYTHYLNQTELGRGNTHDCYLLVPTGVDMSKIFPVGVSVEVIDQDKKRRYNLKSAFGREFRINQMGPIFQDWNACAGDEVKISEVKNAVDRKVYIKVSTFNRVVFVKSPNGIEIFNLNRLTPFSVGTNKYSVQTDKGVLDIDFYQSKKKRTDSPTTTDFYTVKLGGNDLPDDKTFLTIDTVCKVGKLEKVFTNQFVTSTEEISLFTRGLKPIPSSGPKPPYSDADFIRETFLTQDQTDEIRTILQLNKNIILEGAPGVGKTWTAKRIAYLMQKEVNNDTIQTVQFHQSYSYETFIEGYKPDATSFHLEDGIFLRFVEKAIADPNNDYFFIIDEINRGNISKIMGELLCLIEATYRGKEHAMTLSYSHDEFYVPTNLYIIGMMNTADRSLSIIDYALRRRFAFISMMPKFDTQEFKNYNKAVKNPKFAKVIDAVKALNDTIEKEPSLGRGFEIGHSYFCFEQDVTDTELLTILKYQIVPMLKEYWFDNPSKAEDEAKKLLDSLK